MDMTSGGLDPADFAETARRAVAACHGLDVAGQAARLAADGLLGIMAVESAGGLGLGLAFAVPVVTAAGAGLPEFPIIESVLLARVFGDRHAGPIIVGDTVATIAWDGAIAARSDGGGMRLDGVAGHAPGLRGASALLVRLEGDAAALVSLDTAGVAREDMVGLDPETPAQIVRLTAVHVSRHRLLPAGSWRALGADALVLRAAAILGAAEACLDLAQEHVSTRKQFGKPLVAFQAVRHALARQKLGLEGIRGALARSLDEGNALDLGIRRAAFAAAALHGPAIAEGALQLHGGMGFTWDIPVHRYLRRIRDWETQGGAPAVREAIAAALIDEAPHEGTSA